MEKYPDGLIPYLSQFISENRLKRFDEVLNFRTHHITAVIENIYQSQNASAVIRTAECFGVHQLHIIDDKRHFELNPDVVVGSKKWIKLHKYRKKDANNTKLCFEKLKTDGYRIACFSPKQGSCSLDELDISKKTALVFGNEAEGISDYATDNADVLVHVPMFGFTESFNISVCAAIAFHSVMMRLHNSNIKWKLDEEEKNEIKIEWMKKVLKRFDLYLSEFFTKHGE